MFDQMSTWQKSRLGDWLPSFWDGPTELLYGEWLLNQRNAAGNNQQEEARQRKMNVRTYNRHESGEYDQGRGTWMLELEDLQKCLILRRRASLSQQQLADKIGVTRYYVMRMETGKANPKRLISFWKEQCANGVEAE